MGVFSGIGHTLGNIGGAIKKGVVDTGHAIGKVGSNPLVLGGLSLIPGVGPLAAAGIGGISGLIKPGGNLGTGLKGAATGAAAGLAGNAVRGGLGAIKAGGLGALIHGGGADSAGSGGVAGDLLSRFGGVGGALGGGSKGGPSLLDLGLGGLSAYNAAELGKKSGQFAQQASDQAHQNYNERGGLRAAGVAGMLNPQPSQFGAQAINNLGTVSGANPFARPAFRQS